MERALFALQRLTALLLAPLVLVHLGVILYASRSGLTVAEILGRLRGSTLWIAFYGLFVLAVAIHAPIGVRSILVEWGRMPRGPAAAIAWVLALLLLALGLRAVYAVGVGR